MYLVFQDTSSDPWDIVTRYTKVQGSNVTSYKRFYTIY